MISFQIPNTVFETNQNICPLFFFFIFFYLFFFLTYIPYIYRLSLLFTNWNFKAHGHCKRIFITTTLVVHLINLFLFDNYCWPPYWQILETSRRERSTNRQGRIWTKSNVGNGSTLLQFTYFLFTCFIFIYLFIFKFKTPHLNKKKCPCLFADCPKISFSCSSFQNLSYSVVLSSPFLWYIYQCFRWIILTLIPL